MTDTPLVHQIATDVKYLRVGFDELRGDFKAHVANDDERLKPLETAQAVRSAGSVVMGHAINTGIAMIGVYIAYRTGVFK